MHALYLCGVCCYLLNDQVGKTHFYEASLELLNKLFSEKVAIEKKELMSFYLHKTLYNGLITNPINDEFLKYFSPRLPLLLASLSPIGMPIILGTIVTHSATLAAIYADSSRKQTLIKNVKTLRKIYQEGNYEKDSEDRALEIVNNEKIKGVEFTWLELRNAITTALGK